MTHSQVASEFTVHVGGTPVIATLWRRDWADPYGPRRGTIATITLDRESIGKELAQAPEILQPLR